jgi:hypothetical protein
VNSDRRNYRVSFSKIRDRIGFRAQRTLESGIHEIIEAFRSGQISNYRQPAYNNSAFLKENGRVDAKDELDVKVMAAFASAGSRSVHIRTSGRTGALVDSELKPSGRLDVAISGAPAE